MNPFQCSELKHWKPENQPILTANILPAEIVVFPLDTENGGNWKGGSPGVIFPVLLSTSIP